MILTEATVAPRLYMLNANSLAKRQAVAHLARDMFHYHADVAVISETHLTQRHTDKNLAISGYSLWRRDRVGRPGGGVAVYAARQVSLLLFGKGSRTIDLRLNSKDKDL